MKTVAAKQQRNIQNTMRMIPHVCGSEYVSETISPTIVACCSGNEKKLSRGVGDLFFLVLKFFKGV